MDSDDEKLKIDEDNTMDCNYDAPSSATDAPALRDDDVDVKRDLTAATLGPESGKVKKEVTEGGEGSQVGEDHILLPNMTPLTIPKQEAVDEGVDSKVIERRQLETSMPPTRSDKPKLVSFDTEVTLQI